MAESEIEVRGGIVVHEFIGPEDGEVVVLTPGGRFSKDAPGVRELAEGLAAGGKRVLLWDRPNCGKSDVQIFGRSESHMRAEILGGLLSNLGIDRVIAAGGSGGARDTIVFTLMFPEKVRKLITWNIVGGNYSILALAGVYVLPELRAVRLGGIEAILKLSGKAGSWEDLCRVNPRNTERLRAIGSEEFERVMFRWMAAFTPKPNEPIPGVADWEFADITVPTLIVRGGERDFDHPKLTSIIVHNLIKGSKLIEPPWAEDAWEQSQRAFQAGTGFLFDPWPQAAPAFLEFIDAPE